MEKKGISLITLIITIVVVIILAVAVILALGQNNSINTARISSIAQTKDSIESGVLMYTSNVKAKTLGLNSTKEILIDLDKYKIVSGVEAKITEDGNEITLYEISKELAKTNLNIDLKDSVSNASWYINEYGKVYLIFNDSNKIPSYFKENGEIVSTLSSFVTYSGAISKTKFIITYNSDGGGEVSPQTKTKGVAITLSQAPSKEGYNFVHWKKDNSTTYEAGEEYTVDEDITLTAVWEIATRYSVTYNTNGGSSVENEENIFSGTEITIAAAPTKEDYRFVNWKDASDNTYNPGDKYTANADLSLIAVWAKTKFNITYDSNGGTSVSSQVKTEDIDITLAQAPTKNNTTFMYWEDTNGNHYNAGATYTTNADLSLTAVWGYSAANISAMTTEAEKQSVIGKSVTNVNSTNRWDNWKVFSSDGTKIMLIAGDYVPVSLLPSGHGFGSGSHNTTYCVNSTSRANLLAALTNTTTFNGFKDSAGKVTEARIPTIQDFALSYNAAEHDGETYKDSTYPDGCPRIQKVYYKSGANNGYNVGPNDAKTATSNETVLADSYWAGYFPVNETNYGNLWVIEDSTKAYAYWLASASSGSTDNVFGVHCNGSEGNYTYSSTNRGLRPVVVLASNVKLVQNIDGTNITYTLE